MTRNTTSRALKALAVTAALALPLGLGGCISLFPKSDPAQMYRFGDVPAADAPAGNVGDTIGVLKPPSAFTKPAAGDQLLTISPGGEAAYIAEARWIAPAVVLWDEAVQKAFDANTGAARLIARGERQSADMAIRLDVRTFEARYDQGKDAPPNVTVSVRAVLLKTSDRTLLDDRMFTASVRASDNRQGPIVAAYDQATGKVLGEIVGWTNEMGKRAK
ncbi:ABC-type transport auxiliary lipoprotein family protein [Caulobacter segnis]|uniref:ABC-type transport auxiliary lipoprotein family protein n=1 Tax=Caulobacter segnis TaxID=88688 RepID=UPI00240F6D78|nr:ABC-type transport auxiliary lipoprotein family protein [Caulobacter segnis]MDG2522527.1 ABC-type transport auxiliary lipoprotein family protein [Caulobacter segnis]